MSAIDEPQVHVEDVALAAPEATTVADDPVVAPRAKTPRRNSFDLARMVAAACVLVSHSFALTGNPEPMIGSAKLGTVAVWVFFAMSGYLVAQSWDQHPRLSAFLAKRVLRIFPALIVVVVSSTVLLGLISDLPYLEYVKDPTTGAYLNNIMLFNTSYTLPGVFTDNLYPVAVNGSLWTLAYEVTMYGALAALGVLGGLRRHRLVVAWAVLLVLNALMMVPSLAARVTWSVFYLDPHFLLPLALMFCSGALLQALGARARYPLAAWPLALIAFGGFSTLWPTLTPVAAGFLLGYGVLGFCHLHQFSGFGKFGDFSYGVYLYAFVIQQVVGHATHTADPLVMIALALPLSIAAGALSWHLVEKPALLWKQALGKDRYPVLDRDRARRTARPVAASRHSVSAR